MLQDSFLKRSKKPIKHVPELVEFKCPQNNMITTEKIFDGIRREVSTTGDETDSNFKTDSVVR